MLAASLKVRGSRAGRLTPIFAWLGLHTHTTGCHQEANTADGESGRAAGMHHCKGTLSMSATMTYLLDNITTHGPQATIAVRAETLA